MLVDEKIDQDKGILGKLNYICFTECSINGQITWKDAQHLYKSEEYFIFNICKRLKYFKFR